MYIMSGVCCWHSPDLILTRIPLPPVSSTATLGLFWLITLFTRSQSLVPVCVCGTLEKTSLVRTSPSGKPRGLRLYYSNDYLGSLGVHLSAPVWHWLESLPGFIGLEAQTLTGADISNGGWVGGVRCNS